LGNRSREWHHQALVPRRVRRKYAVAKKNYYRELAMTDGTANFNCCTKYYGNGVSSAVRATVAKSCRDNVEGVKGAGMHFDFCGLLQQR
jgi:hypothetical protein